MPKSQVDAAALLAAAVAGALAVIFARGPLDPLSSVIGLTLLLVLFAYDREGYRTVFQSLAFSAVCGFCVMLIAVVVFRFIGGGPALGYGMSGPVGEVRAASSKIFEQRLPLTWLGATIILWAIDRARMSSRQEAAPQAAGGPLPARRGFIPDFATPATASSGGGTTESELPPSPPPAPLYHEPAPATTPTTTPPPARAGKETMIYVTLMGEGLNVLRSVKAEHLGRDFYRIIDSTPEGETWQFQSGQVVRCKKRNLSSGKALVAIEEAPRSQ